MKKLFLALLALSASATAATAQVEIGLKVSPSIASLRVDSPSRYDFESESSKLGIGGGLVVDYFFGENYAFGTGVLLTSKGGTVRYQDVASQGGSTQDQEISLQYVEVPATVKLFTNDITTDTKLYFQVGGSLRALVSSKINEGKYYNDPATSQETKALKHFIVPDAALLAGLGVEYQVGQSTKVLAGVSYHRGLLNVDRYFRKTRDFDDVTLKNNEIALDLGLKF